MGDITTHIKHFIVDNFLFGGDISDVSDTASLLETGVIDSLGVLQLISFAEETFAITVADNEVVPQNFGSVVNMAGYIQSKLIASTPAVVTAA